MVNSSLHPNRQISSSVVLCVGVVGVGSSLKLRLWRRRCGLFPVGIDVDVDHYKLGLFDRRRWRNLIALDDYCSSIRPSSLAAKGKHFFIARKVAQRPTSTCIPIKLVNLERRETPELGVLVEGGALSARVVETYGKAHFDHPRGKIRFRIPKRIHPEASGAVHPERTQRRILHPLRFLFGSVHQWSKCQRHRYEGHHGKQNVLTLTFRHLKSTYSLTHGRIVFNDESQVWELCHGRNKDRSIDEVTFMAAATLEHINLTPVPKLLPKAAHSQANRRRHAR
ncbi:hypothetical protein EV421DRAFT_1740688 [Armillaria borealis]|uniref:Uncharacterized protein n=1 Tax=Armillaria borealis TaxID=47425 RepID=A0AA39J391_9AGAR|nr:hypothetical protein EV421DRAFT_1740688 [Armillaria borealis]